MTIPNKTSTLSPTTCPRQSMPSAPEAAILRASPALAIAPHLMPLLELVADLIARDVLVQRRESNTALGPEGDHTSD